MGLIVVLSLQRIFPTVYEFKCLPIWRSILVSKILCLEGSEFEDRKN